MIYFWIKLGPEINLISKSDGTAFENKNFFILKLTPTYYLCY